MLAGGCLCGEVRFEISGQPLYADWCHCGNCRRRSGAAADPCLSCKSTDVTITRGREHIRSFTPPGAATRYFCGRCGSPAPDPNPDGPLTGVSMGTLDGDPGIRPVLRKGLAWCATWDPDADQRDELPRFDELPTREALREAGLLSNELLAVLEGTSSTHPGIFEVLGRKRREWPPEKYAAALSKHVSGLQEAFATGDLGIIEGAARSARGIVGRLGQEIFDKAGPKGMRRAQGAVEDEAGYQVARNLSHLWDGVCGWQH